MRYWLAVIIVLVLLFETYSIFPTDPEPGREIAKTPYVTGIFHVHSKYSDGSGDIETIATAAKEAGIDFVIVTDHGTSKARKEGQEKNWNGVDTFIEMETTTPSGELVIFYSHTPSISLSDDAVQKLAYRVFQAEEHPEGVFVSIAHPSHVKTPWLQLERFADGMEVINLDSMWQREFSDSKMDFLLTMGLYPFNRYLSLLRFLQIYPKDISSWDSMSAFSRDHFGILASDTHEKLNITPLTSLSWPTYRETFRLGSNIVFLKEPLKADFSDRKKQVYDGIRNGRLAMVFQAIYPFAGNSFYLRCQNTTYRVGDTVSPGGPCEFVIETPKSLPYGHKIRLLRDGEVEKEIETSDPQVTVSVGKPGAYRAEVWVNPKTRLNLFLQRSVPYVFYNPIYLR